jgi:hypothetical protein
MMTEMKETEALKRTNQRKKRLRKEGANEEG